MYMKSLRRVVNQINSGLLQLASVMDHLHMARAYQPMSPKMLPRWRNLGRAITPYHFMTPVLIPVQQQPVQRNEQ
jgi:hypothetical protein